MSYVFEEMMRHDLKEMLSDGIHLQPESGNDAAGRALRQTMDQVYTRCATRAGGGEPAGLLGQIDRQHSAHNRIWIDVVQVHQDDDRHVVVDEPRDLGAKPRHPAALIHEPVTPERAELPTEAVRMRVPLFSFADVHICRRLASVSILSV